MIGPDQDWVDEQRRNKKEERRQLHQEWHRKNGVPCSGYRYDAYCVQAEKWATEVMELRRLRSTSGGGNG